MPSNDDRLLNIEKKLEEILSLLKNNSIEASGSIKSKSKEQKVKNTKNVQEDDTPAPEYQEPHIMISYNWGVQTLAVKIANKLKEKGLRVWIDVNQMEGDLADAMSDAVEDSLVILPFLSQKYQDSKNCQLELKYAHNQNKLILPIMAEPGNWSPKKWLGFLVNSKLYIDFRKGLAGDEAGFSESMDLLCEQLKRIHGNFAEMVEKRYGIYRLIFKTESSSPDIVAEKKGAASAKFSELVGRTLSKESVRRLPMGVLENTFITHTFLLKETKTGEAVALFQTNNDPKLVNAFEGHFELYIDYVNINGDTKPGLKFLFPKKQSKQAMIVNDPNEVVQRITDNKVNSSYIQGDKGYTLSIKNATNVMFDAYWVNYSGGMRLLGRHSIPVVPENWVA